MFSSDTLYASRRRRAITNWKNLHVKVVLSLWVRPKEEEKLVDGDEEENESCFKALFK